MFVSSQIVLFYLIFFEYMKRLYSIFTVIAAAVVLWACGPAEVSNIVTYELDALCTVNKSRIEPEFSDSSFMFAKNVDEFGLETGDRAFMTLTCTYDLYSEVAPMWTILNVRKKIPTYPLSADIDTAAYQTPIIALEPVDFFNDFGALTWVWNEKQNISIVYNGVEATASFAMTVRGVKDGFIELDLFVDADESEKKTTTLLTFDISNIKELLTDEQRAQLPAGGELKTRIYTKRMKNGVLEDWAIDGNYIVNY